MAGGGGSWKVAYADFVTAMMAFFLVMWLASQEEKIKEAVQRTFENPFRPMTLQSTGIIPNEDIILMRSELHGAFDDSSLMELEFLRRVHKDLTEAMQKEISEEDNPVLIDMSHEGLRIQLFNNARKPIFQPNSTELTDYGDFVLNTLTWQIIRHKNFYVEIRGHCVERSSDDPKVDYWQLSSDRANSARKKMVFFELPDRQIREVSGYGTSQLLPGTSADDSRNDRIEILIIPEI
ncbi:MAG: OmpA family protein [Verrucomicrobia bacterium]|nr:OmpA family protein [Verrucomicrobiota bacterium]